MNAIRRYSSLRERLDKVFLAEKLAGAVSYKRIAGYFRSSIFELVGEEIADIPKVQIICNSELDAADINVSKAARETALKGQWNEAAVGVETLLKRERYRKLYELLVRGNVEIRVVPKDKVFLHGKAGVIETPQGKTAFLGSINETRSAFAENYEILWEDPSPEGVAWVEEEFAALWKESFPLPDAIITEIKRVADRIEVAFKEIATGEVPGAALAESPLYRAGEELQAWQRSFVAMFLAHRENYGKVRLLLADEVGLGKTLSLAASALVAALLGDGRVLILCPSTLTLQWQAEIKDRLGIPSAVWLSGRKAWLDQDGRVISSRGVEDCANCPCQVAIVSTGLIFHQGNECHLLLGLKYGTVILDEAHKARRRGGVGTNKNEPNNLLEFMKKIASRTRHLLLGTATPIQTDVQELWDLMDILGVGADFVFGKESFNLWKNKDRVLPYIKGKKDPADAKEAWELIRNPLPAACESDVYRNLRGLLEIPDDCFFSDRGYGSLGNAKMQVEATLESDFFRRDNPIVRHTVLRKRRTLEEMGLLEKVAVDIHPDANGGVNAYPGQNFTGIGLMTNHPFDLAYQAAGKFTELLKKRGRGGGFMKSLLLQRICSSFASGRGTAQRMLERRPFEDEEDEDSQSLLEESANLSHDESEHLRIIVQELSRDEARDPKLETIRYFLTTHRSENKTWVEHGCILFSQYYDTTRWIGERLARELPGEVIAVYAGLGKSGLLRDGEFAATDRENIKTLVKRREIRLVVATDAACEGLNLQTLGSLINVDLPWNPSRLEQRLGRIKRFGQARRSVDMLNLVYHETQDEKVYEALSRRMKDRYDIFGGLPDTIDDDWIDDEEELEEQMDKYIHLRKQNRDVYELRYRGTIDPEKNRWEECSRVFSQSDVVKKLSEPW